jgi:hypothetical protein
VKKYYHDVLGYETFEEYCKKRWDFTGRHAERLMAAAKVIENTRPVGRIPDTERQARHLASLTAEQQLIAWQKAVETAPDGITAAEIVQPGRS